MSKYVPLNGKFVLKPLDEEKSSGGILLNTSTRSPHQKAVVENVPDTNYYDGNNIPHDIYVGSVVLFDPQYGYDVDGGLIITDYSAIIALVSKEND